MTNTPKCPTCGGDGVGNVCPTCNGTGVSKPQDPEYDAWLAREKWEMQEILASAPLDSKQDKHDIESSRTPKPSEFGNVSGSSRTPELHKWKCEHCGQTLTNIHALLDECEGGHDE